MTKIGEVLKQERLKELFTRAVRQGWAPLTCERVQTQNPSENP